jgi:hypothetical protein
MGTASSRFPMPDAWGNDGVPGEVLDHFRYYQRRTPAIETRTVL